MADTPSDLPTPPGGSEGLDFSNMPIEDLVQLTLHSAGENASRDLHDSLDDVAARIRERVANGDTGTPAPGSTAPGWGGGISSWLPWLALIVVGAIVGSAVGVSGLAGRPAGETTVDVPVSISESAPVFACVDGPLVARIPGGTRVLATERSDDSTWVGVRDPLTLGGTLWIGLGDVSLDDGVPALSALPVGGDCPTTVVTLPEPEPVVTQEPAPGPNPQPSVPSDITQPAILQYGGFPTSLQSCPGYDTSSLYAVASDNVGVVRVQVTWSGSSAGAVELSPSGGQWVGSITVPLDSSGPITVVFKAFDQAGNQSPIKSVKFNVSSCLI